MPLLLLFWSWMLAWAGSVQVEVDRPSLQVGETLSFYLTFVEVNPGAPPRLPPIEGLKLDYQGLRYATVRVNGKSRDTVTFVYAMTGLSAGQRQIPAMELTVGGEKLRTTPLNIQVTPRATQGLDTRITASLESGEGPVTQAWVGQTLVYHLDFATMLRLLDRRWTPPVFEGLLAEQTLDAQVKEYDSRIDGKVWSRLELSLPLVVTAPGSRNVSPGVLAVQVPDSSGNQTRGLRVLSGVRNEVFSTEALPLTARPLPEAGRSPDFTGLVGHFTLEASLSNMEVKLGESATLRIVLRGDGTLSGFTLPEPPDGLGFTAYDDSPTISSRIEGGRFTTEAQFRRAIVPEAEGVLEIPPLELQVFDPTLGQYTTLSIPAQTLRVLPGEAQTGISSFSSGQADPRQDVVEEGDDILPVHARVSSRSTRFTPWAPGPLLLVGIPWLGFLGLWLRDTLRARQPRVDPVQELRRRVDSLASADLSTLESVFHECAAMLLRIPPAALERERLSELPPALRDEAQRLYADLEGARYGGGADAGLRERVAQVCRHLLEVKP